MNDVAALIEKVFHWNIFTDIPETTHHIIGFFVWENFIYQDKFETNSWVGVEFVKE